MAKMFTAWRRSATYALLHGALRLGRLLGPNRAMDVGGWVGEICGLPGPLRRRLAANWRAAGIEPTKELLDRYFHRLGLWIGWSLAVYEHGMDKSGIAARCEEGDARPIFEAAFAKGRGVVLAETHFFAHEIVAGYVNRHFPVAALVRESKFPAHNAVKEKWYRALGLPVVHRARHSSLLADTVELIRVLRTGKALGITPDLIVPKAKGIAVRMFGKDVCLAPGFAFLAMRTGAPIITSRLEWIDADSPRTARVRLNCNEPITIPDGGNRAATMRDAVQHWCDVQEAALRKNPENWLFWLDKNWTEALQGRAG